MYKIIIMGSFNPSLSYTIAGFRNIRTSYFIKDESVDDGGTFENFWEKHGAKKGELSENCLNEVDLVFVCGYTKIIKSELLKKYVFVNIHAGNLPKWRGTSANSWAIINGDYNIAYSIHRVTDELDGGPLYHKFTYLLHEDEKYGDGRIKLEGILAKELETVLIGICSGDNTGKEQQGTYRYCCSFRKSDGEVSDWAVPTRKLLDLFRVFGQPYGSGMFLEYRNKQYEIMDIFSDDMYDNYDCVPGAVVNNDGTFVWIKTMDNVIVLSDLKDDDGGIVKASTLLRIGVRL